jgi:hypothetical protein
MYAREPCLNLRRLSVSIHIHILHAQNEYSCTRTWQLQIGSQLIFLIG